MEGRTMENQDLQILTQLVKALTHITSVVNQLSERIENEKPESGKVYRWN